MTKYVSFALLVFLSNSLFSTTELLELSTGLIVGYKRNLFFVLEKVENNVDIQKWQHFHSKQREKGVYFRDILQIDSNSLLTGDFVSREGSYLNKIRKHSAVLKDMSGIVDDLETKITCFIEAWNPKFDFWVAYIRGRPAFEKLNFSDFDDVEMWVTVTTRPEVPFQHHFGITRAPLHFDKYLRGELSITPGLSFDLHGFVAKSMLVQFGRFKRFQITVPVEAMYEILFKNLCDVPNAMSDSWDDEIITQTDNTIKVDNRECHQLSQFIVRDWDKKIIFEADYDKFQLLLSDWFYEGSSLPEGMEYFVFDNDVVAARF